MSKNKIVKQPIKKRNGKIKLPYSTSEIVEFIKSLELHKSIGETYFFCRTEWEPYYLDLCNYVSAYLKLEDPNKKNLLEKSISGTLKSNNNFSSLKINNYYLTKYGEEKIEKWYIKHRKLFATLASIAVIIGALFGILYKLV